MMRILNVTPAYFPFEEKGGPVVKVSAIAERLARRGCHVTVLTTTFDPARASGALQVRGVEVNYLPPLLRYRSLTVNPGIFPFCRTRLRGFDLVHVYGLYDLLGPVVASYARSFGIPYVVEPMGMFRPIIRSLWLKRFYHATVGRALIRGAARWIATSGQEQQELVEEGIAPSRIVLRRNGLDLDAFRDLPPRGIFRRECGIPPDALLVLYLGRISRKKGLDLLVEAFAQAPPEAFLAIVGPDDADGSLPLLNRRRRELGLERRSLILGPRYQDAKITALVDADIFVLSSWNENFGNAVAEAIACGTPVVVSDRCGIAPLVADRAGLVVPCEVSPLRTALNQMLGDAGLRGRLRAGCAEVARALSWEDPVNQMESLYATLVSEAQLG